MLRYHDFHLRGYAVTDYGKGIVLDLVSDLSAVPKEVSTIAFTGVLTYHFIHSGGAVIIDITETEVSKIVSEHEAFLAEAALRHGLHFWEGDKNDYCSRVEQAGFRGWEILSAIGFYGFVLAKQIEQREITENDAAGVPIGNE